jgi:hypothetical protein
MTALSQLGQLARSVVWGGGLQQQRFGAQWLTKPEAGRTGQGACPPGGNGCEYQLPCSVCSKTPFAKQVLVALLCLLAVAELLCREAWSVTALAGAEGGKGCYALVLAQARAEEGCCSSSNLVCRGEGLVMQVVDQAVVAPALLGRTNRRRRLKF